MYKYLVNLHLIQPYEIYFIPVGGNMSLSCLPVELKERVTQHWLNELKNVSEQNVIDSALALLKEMNNIDKHYMLQDFIREMKQLDNRRNENFVEVFPELKELLNG